MTSFASVDELAAALGVDTPSDAVTAAKWQAALDDATGYLQTVIGQPIAAGTATLSVRTDSNGQSQLWLVPITSITSIVDCDDHTLTTDDWRLDGQRLYLPRARCGYTVVLTYGYDPIPAEITRWTKVLAATQINASKAGSLGMSNVTSVAVDDANVGYDAGMSVLLPPETAQWLKATFGGEQ